MTDAQLAQLSSAACSTPTAGVTCRRGSVIQLTLPHSIASLPTSLGNLTHLEELHVTSPSLAGTLPTELGLLTALRSLVIRRGRLSGTLPSRLGGVCSTERDDAPAVAAHAGRGCHFSTTLQLTNTLLSGTLPRHAPSVGVGMLDLHGNQRLSGTLPAWIARAHRARLDGTALSGSLPASIAGSRLAPGLWQLEIPRGIARSPAAARALTPTWSTDARWSSDPRVDLRCAYGYGPLLRAVCENRSALVAKLLSGGGSSGSGSSGGGGGGTHTPGQK